MIVVRITRFGMRLSQFRRAASIVSARFTRRCIRFSMRSLMCCSGMSMYGTIRFDWAITSITSSVTYIG